MGNLTQGSEIRTLTQAETIEAYSRGTGIRPTNVDPNSLLGLSEQVLNASKPTRTAVSSAAIPMVAGQSVMLKPVNMNRIDFTVHNTTTGWLYLKLDSAAASTIPGGYNYPLAPGGCYQSDNFEWLGVIQGVCTESGTISVSEST